MKEQPQDEAPYYQHDLMIGEVRFWRDDEHTLRLKMHHAVEPFRERREIIPLAHPSGTRDYFHAKPYILIPDIRVKVTPYLDELGDGRVGEVTSSSWEGMRHEEVGQAQAWYYRPDKTLILWECFLDDRYQDGPPQADANHQALWRGFERTLLDRLPDARRIVTTWEDTYDRDDWKAFVEAEGYTQRAPAVFEKRTETDPTTEK